MNWYIKVLRQYADFSGRARRMEYWMFSLFHAIFFISIFSVENFVGYMIVNLGFGLGVYPILSGNAYSFFGGICKENARCREKWLVVFY